MSQKRYNIFGTALLLLLAGFTLAACKAVDVPLPSTNEELGGSISASQSTMPQDFNFDTQNVSVDWDAAAFFASSCASCHGPTGGGSAFAPALNTEAIQTADLDWLIETISYGRTGTAMPAWSIEFSGPLNSDKIAEMAAFIQAGSDWKDAGAIAAEQPVAPTGSGMMGNGGMMGRGMGNGRMP